MLSYTDYAIVLKICKMLSLGETVKDTWGLAMLFLTTIWDCAITSIKFLIKKKAK